MNYEQKYKELTNSFGVSHRIPVEDAITEIESGENYVSRCCCFSDIMGMLDNSYSLEELREELEHYFYDVIIH